MRRPPTGGAAHSDRGWIACASRSPEVSTLVFAGLMAGGAAFIGPASAAAPESTYLVLAPAGNSTDKASGEGRRCRWDRRGDLQAARGTRRPFDQPRVATAASGAGVAAVASTTGLGTPLNDDETVETAHSSRAASTGNHK